MCIVPRPCFLVTLSLTYRAMTVVGSVMWSTFSLLHCARHRFLIPPPCVYYVVSLSYINTFPHVLRNRPVFYQLNYFADIPLAATTASFPHGCSSPGYHGISAPNRFGKPRRRPSPGLGVGPNVAVGNSRLRRYCRRHEADP